MSAIQTKEKKKEEDFIQFNMRRHDLWKYFIYTNKLEKIFKQENLIGAKSIYTKLLALFIPKEDDEDERYNEKCFELSSKVIPHFIKDKAYNFEVKKRVKNEAYKKDFGYVDVDTGKGTPKTIIRTYSAQQMITEAISFVVHSVLSKEVKEGKKDKKEEVIRACYKSIVGYIAKEKELPEIISHYKATVISGYVAIECGFTLSADLKPINIKEAPPTNEQIYNALKYFTDPLNPANTKKKHK